MADERMEQDVPEKEEISASQQESEMDTEEQTKQELTDAVFTPAGVAADRYDGEIPLPKQPEEDEYSSLEGIRVWYDFNKEEIAAAIKTFQKQTIFKKYLLYSVIILALFGVQLSQILGGNEETIHVVICVVCVAVLAMIWYLPYNHIRQVQKAMDSYETPPRYFMEIYPGAVRTGTGEQAVLFRFQQDDICAIETDTQFIISFKNQSLFPIPKRCCPDQVDEIRSTLKEHLGKKYQRVSP